MAKQILSLRLRILPTLPSVNDFSLEDAKKFKMIDPESFKKCFEFRRTLRLDGYLSSEGVKCELNLAKEMAERELLDALQSEETQTINVKKAEDVYRVASEEVKNAQKKLSEALQALRKQQKKLEKIQRNKSEKSEDVDIITKICEKSQNVILIHKTASLKQLSEKQAGIIYITKTDAEFFGDIDLMPDHVFVNEETEFVTSLPYGFFDNHSSEYCKSVIDFAEMVINISMSMESDVKIEPVYANKDIDNILKLNGYT